MTLKFAQPTSLEAQVNGVDWSRSRTMGRNWRVCRYHCFAQGLEPKRWKINIQNFAALFSCKSICSSASGSNPVEKGSGLICGLQKAHRKGLEIARKGLRGPYKRPQFLYHWKTLQWLKDYSAELWKVLPKRPTFTSHYFEKKKKETEKKGNQRLKWRVKFHIDCELTSIKKIAWIC